MIIVKEDGVILVKRYISILQSTTSSQNFISI